MPQILIVADAAESSEIAVYRERVDAMHFGSEHARARLV